MCHNFTKTNCGDNEPFGKTFQFDNVGFLFMKNRWLCNKKVVMSWKEKKKKIFHKKISFPFSILRWADDTIKKKKKSFCIISIEYYTCREYSFQFPQLVSYTNIDLYARLFIQQVNCGSFNWRQWTETMENDMPSRHNFSSFLLLFHCGKSFFLFYLLFLENVDRGKKRENIYIMIENLFFIFSRFCLLEQKDLTLYCRYLLHFIKILSTYFE